MFERVDLYRRRCVRKVIDVVQSVPSHWQVRSPMVLDETTAGLLLLWSWLRFEKDFLAECLEELGADLAALSQRVDELLNEQRFPSENSQSARQSPLDSACPPRLWDLTALWLDRAADEALLLRQNYLGMEHLILAFLRTEGSPLASLFSRHGIDARRLTESVLDAIRRRQTESALRPIGIKTSEASPEANRQEAATSSGVGLRKRFSIAILMAWVTLFAMVFSLLKWLEAPPEIFGVITILMFCVGLAQMWLFGGKNPRGASILAGAIVLPAEVFILNLATHFITEPIKSIFLSITQSLVLMIFFVPVGAFFGYLLGGLTAGIVLMLDYYENRKAANAQEEIDSEAVVAELVDDREG
jgi:hypothetical protein